MKWSELYKHTDIQILRMFCAKKGLFTTKQDSQIVFLKNTLIVLSPPVWNISVWILWGLSLVEKNASNVFMCLIFQCGSWWEKQFSSKSVSE